MEDRSKEQLQSNQSSAGVVPHSKGGEKQAAELDVQKHLRWKDGGFCAFVELMVAARYLAGGLTSAGRR